MPTHTTIGFRYAVLTAAAALASLQPYPARASLGEPARHVAADVQQLRGAVKSLVRLNYQVDEITLPSGAVLREFSVPGGSVFAVAWSGPAMPNLRQALGTYFDAYAGAAREKHAGRRHVRVEGPDLVVQSNGHMRAFTGRAYLPQALPAGVSLEDIR